MQGWGSGIVSSQNFPPMEEVTGVLKTISYQACYLLQEGPQLYDINTEYSNTSIVKDIVGNNLRFYISKQNGNIGHSLTDTDWWQLATFTGSNPIGTPQFTMNPNAILPDNCIWLEGAEVSRTDYNNLFAIYGTTYGEGNGSTTFNLPDYRNRYICGIDTNLTFGYINAGLPDLQLKTTQAGAHSHYTQLDSGWGSDPYQYVSLKWDNGDRIKYRGQQVWTSSSGAHTHDVYSENSIVGSTNTVKTDGIKVRVYTRFE